MSGVQLLQGGISSIAAPSNGPVRGRGKDVIESSSAGSAPRSRPSAAGGNPGLYRDRDAMEAAIDQRVGRFTETSPSAFPGQDFSAPLSEEEEEIALEETRRSIVRGYAANAKRLDRLMADISVSE